MHNKKNNPPYRNAMQRTLLHAYEEAENANCDKHTKHAAAESQQEHPAAPLGESHSAAFALLCFRHLCESSRARAAPHFMQPVSLSANERNVVFIMIRKTETIDARRIFSGNILWYILRFIPPQ